MEQIEKSYSKGENAAELYASYEGGDIVPIYTPEQFAKVGTGETVYVAETGKIYTFSTDKTYMFYGQSEDITEIINKIIDERLNSSPSEEKATLLWEKISGNSYNTIKEEITVENLQQYKRLVVQVQSVVETSQGSDQVMLYEYLDIKDIKKNVGVYMVKGSEYIPMIKYINETTLGIRYSDMMENYKFELYGIE